MLTVTSFAKASLKQKQQTGNARIILYAGADELKSIGLYGSTEVQRAAPPLVATLFR